MSERQNSKIGENGLRSLSDGTYVQIGWWLFVLCAILFLTSSVRAGDPVAIAGSLAFLAANVAFMIPIYRRPK